MSGTGFPVPGPGPGPSLPVPPPGGTPILPPPDPFIKNGAINATPIWTFILGDPTLKLQNHSAGGSVILESTASTFWDLTFSSVENASRIDSALGTSAAVGDTVGSGVMGLVKPTTGPLLSPIKLSEVSKNFGIQPTNTPAVLQSFFNAIDTTGQFGLIADLDRPARNALWAVPGDPYIVAITIAFQLAETGATAQIEGFLNTHFGISIHISGLKPKMIFTKLVHYTQNTSDPTKLVVSSAYQLVMSFQVGTFQVSATFSPSGLDFIFSDLQNVVPTTSIIERLGAAVLSTAGAVTGNPTASDLPKPGAGQPGAFNSLVNVVDLWYLSIDRTITGQTSAGDPIYGPTFWSIGILGVWPTKVPTQPLLLGLFWDSRTSTFSGEVLLNNSFPDPPATRQYDYNFQTDLPFATKQRLNAGLPTSFDLWSIFSDSNNPPAGLPTTVNTAKVAYRKVPATNGYILGLKLAVSTSPLVTGTKPDPKAAPSGFSWDKLSVAALVQSTQTTTVDIQIFAAFSLKAPSAPAGTPVPLPATLRVDLEYFSGSFWMLHGRVENLSVALLYDSFEHSIKDAAIGALGKLSLRSLDMLYTYAQGNATSFLMTGVLLLGDLELDLSYQYVSGLPSVGVPTAASITWSGGASPSGVALVNPTGTENSRWVFEADLGTTNKTSTIRSVVNSISPTTGSALPGFVGDISLAPSGGKDFMKLRMEGGSDLPGLVLTFWFTILDFSLTFVSLPTSSGTKRILRVAFDTIPLISGIPVVKELPQPFDTLLYLWVDDESDKGLNMDELKIINDELTSKLKIAPIAYKKTNQGSSPPAALQAGHHFMVTEKGDVILDHNFSDAGPQTTTQTHLVAPGDGNRIVIRDAAAGGAGQDPPPTKGNMDKQLPFLSISAVTLQFHSGPSVGISFDATVTLGPIGFSVIGFEIDLNLGKVNLNEIGKSIEKGALSFGIRGLSVKIDNPPLLIAGVFIHDKATINGVTTDAYKGGLALGFEAWQFLAVGEYANVTQDGHEYESVFIFAKLDGPLITLAFATISGVRIGFGYNSIVRSPAINELASFPFLAGSGGSGSGNDPLAVLQSMTGGNGAAAWVTVKEDSYWFAAGLSMTAFDILSITAVLMLGFRSGGVVISVFADGIAQMPPGVPSDATLFYVEIGMLAELNTVDGYFTVQAALAPSSHVLVSSCRLTGGFALINWFSPNAHSGDFVFTVGGYHRAYSPPAWYPQQVDRLGISFTLGDMINVTGYVYFAITPKCVMGGGGIHLSLDVGPVSAWLDISLDVFIQFSPFHYMADMSVSVGCAITINVWFVHIRISISLGASLHIEGPDPFGGFANVEFYLFSFTIHFGGKVDPPPPAILLEFYQMVATPGPDSQPSSTSTVTDPALTVIKFTLSDGLFPSPKVQPAPGTTTGSPPPSFPNSGASSIWKVKAGTFNCIIGVDFAISSAGIQGFESLTNPSENYWEPVYPLGSTTNPPPFWSKPMRLTTPITSNIVIAVHKLKEDGSKGDLVHGFHGTMIMKDVPAALWGLYDRNDDPAFQTNPDKLLQGDDTPTMNLCLGVQLLPPRVVPTDSSIQEFDASFVFRISLGSFPLQPTPPIQKVLQSTLAHPADPPATRWPEVAADWKAAATAGTGILNDSTVAATGETVQGLLSMFASRLGWDKPPPSAQAVPDANGKMPWMLNGDLPTKLVDSLGQSYAALPRYAATPA